MGKLQWLKMAPQAYPLVCARWQRSMLPSIPAVACPKLRLINEIHMCVAGAAASGGLDPLHGSRHSSPPLELNHEYGGGEESATRKSNNNEEEHGYGSWKYEAGSFAAQAARSKSDSALPTATAMATDLLALPERELLMQCKVETFRASGPGGQHRNKTESAVRLRHLPTGLVSQASEDRSQHNNRVHALKRLRQLIAVEVRRPVEVEGYKAPPELMRILPTGPKAGRKREGGQQIGPNHDDFVLGVQRLLDLLWTTKGSISESAALLGLSTGALSRLIVSDRTLWNAVNNLRASHNLKALRGD